MKKIVLTCNLLSKAAFTEFGDVIEMEGAKHFGINSGTIERYHDLANIDVGVENQGRSNISIGSCNQPVSLPFTLQVMERHPEGTQAFIPMNETPVIVAVAPVSSHIDTEDIRVFVTNGKQGFNYKKGVWHMPLVSTESRQKFVIVDRIGPGDNCDLFELGDCVVEIDCKLSK